LSFEATFASFFEDKKDPGGPKTYESGSGTLLGSFVSEII
jgi:hypothetical protein